MKYLVACSVLFGIVAIGESLGHPMFHRRNAVQVQVNGNWRVKFNLSGIGEKNLIFNSQRAGSGSFLLLDTGPDGKPAPDPLPGVWSQTTNNRVNFSGEVELPLGTCCREVGTLILKGKFNSTDVIAGRAIFIASTEDEENFNGFRSTVGTFTATRVPDKN
jgi:hypothetical protein